MPVTRKTAWRPIHHTMPINRYYMSPVITDDGSTLAAPGVHLLIFNAYPIGRPSKWDRISIYIGVAGEAGKKMRVGLYDSDGSGYPRNLVAQSSEIDVTTTGLKETTIDLTLKAGLYWFAILTDGNPQIPSSPLRYLPIIGGIDGSYACAGWEVNYTYGPLPTVAPTIPSNTPGNASVYNGVLRLKALL